MPKKSRRYVKLTLAIEGGSWGSCTVYSSTAFSRSHGDDDDDAGNIRTRA